MDGDEAKARVPLSPTGVAKVEAMKPANPAAAQGGAVFSAGSEASRDRVDVLEQQHADHETRRRRRWRRIESPSEHEPPPQSASDLRRSSVRLKVRRAVGSATLSASFGQPDIDGECRVGSVLLWAWPFDGQNCGSGISKVKVLKVARSGRETFRSSLLVVPHDEFDITQLDRGSGLKRL